MRAVDGDIIVASQFAGHCDIAPAISIRNLDFCFPDRSGRALRNVSLEIAQGEFVAITGCSGCGKSTLALAMAGYIPHVINGTMSGEVSVCGTDTRQVDLCDLAVRVSLCQQDPESQLCTLSVEDEVRFGPENLALSVSEVLRREEESLAVIGSSRLKGRQIAELSGGEKQRVAIASMLAMNPSILILDEPTSNLDPEAAHEVLLAIERLRQIKKITLVVIEHRLGRFLHMADRLIVMVEGEVRHDGKPDDVYRMYTAMLDSDLGMTKGHFCRVGEPLEEKQVVLQVRDLRFMYEEREVLRDISFTARSGELIGIVGTNGSGKTTFLKCLAGLRQPLSGEAVVCGVNTGLVKISAIAREVGFVFQNPNHQIFENTVADEVTFAGRNFGIEQETIVKRMYRVLSEFDLVAYKAFHPLQLSHGEKRRLNLCSVLLHEPTIVIMDEPFIGQDRINTARIMAAALQLKNSGHAVLMVSHDIDTVFRYCTRIVFFDEGRILADDIPEKVCMRIREIGRVAFLPGDL